MKYLIASDLHGSPQHTRQLLEQFALEAADRLILLGDLYYHGPRNPLLPGYDPMEVSKLLGEVRDNLVVVRGNCDSEVDEMISPFRFRSSYKLRSGGKTFFFTHGHKFNLQNPPQNSFDVLVYGHEHTGYIKEFEGKLFVNTGSVSLPKGGTKHSYVTIEGADVALKELSGAVINRISL